MAQARPAGARTFAGLRYQLQGSTKSLPKCKRSHKGNSTLAFPSNGVATGSLCPPTLGKRSTRGRPRFHVMKSHAQHQDYSVIFTPSISSYILAVLREEMLNDPAILQGIYGTSLEANHFVLLTFCILPPVRTSVQVHHKDWDVWSARG